MPPFVLSVAVTVKLPVAVKVTVPVAVPFAKVTGPPGTPTEISEAVIVIESPLT